MQDQVLRFIDSIPLDHIYYILFISSFVETIFPPYPGDTVIVFCSFAAARQQHALVLVLALSILGSYLGALLLWALGRTWARTPRSGFMGWLSRSSSMDRARSLIRERGTIIVILSRFIPGVRSLIILAAGLAGMRFGRAAWAVALAVIMWQTILVAGGYSVGMYWLEVISFISKAGLALAALALVFIYLIWRRSRARRATAPGDQPRSP